MSVDFGSKLSDLTESILLRDSIGIMRQHLNSLDGSIRKKTADHVNVKSKLNELESSIIRSQAKIENINIELDLLKMTLSENSQLEGELEKYRTRLSILTSTLNKITQELKDNENNAYEKEMYEACSGKTEIVKLIEDADIELRYQITSSTSLKIEVDNYTERANSIEAELHQSECEISKKNVDVAELRKSVQVIENEIQTFRDQEQQSIDASGTSYTVLKKYETQIRTMTDDEKKLSKEIPFEIFKFASCRKLWRSSEWL